MNEYPHDRTGKPEPASPGKNCVELPTPAKEASPTSADIVRLAARQLGLVPDQPGDNKPVHHNINTTIASTPGQIRRALWASPKQEIESSLTSEFVREAAEDLHLACRFKSPHAEGRNKLVLKGLDLPLANANSQQSRGKTLNTSSAVQPGSHNSPDRNFPPPATVAPERHYHASERAKRPSSPMSLSAPVPAHETGPSKITESRPPHPPQAVPDKSDVTTCLSRGQNDGTENEESDHEHSPVKRLLIRPGTTLRRLSFCMLIIFLLADTLIPPGMNPLLVLIKFLPFIAGIVSALISMFFRPRRARIAAAVLLFLFLFHALNRTPMLRLMQCAGIIPNQHQYSREPLAGGQFQAELYSRHVQQ